MAMPRKSELVIPMRVWSFEPPGVRASFFGYAALMPPISAWQKQALHCEILKSERIGHPVRHKVQQLFADGYSNSVSLAQSWKGSFALSFCQAGANA